MAANLITDVDGVRVGSADDARLASGVTVVLFDEPAVASIAINGGAPALRDTALLEPEMTIERVDGFVLSGGSAFGLDAAGGAMAYLVGFTNRDVVRAVAVVDAPLPRVAQLPETDPVERLAFYTTLATKTDATPAVEAGIKRLRDMKFPVSVHDVGDQPRYLTTEELQQLVRWFDSLDRI